MAKKNLLFGLAAAFIVTVGVMAAMPEKIVRLVPASATLFAAVSKNAEKAPEKPGVSNKPTVAGNPVSSLNDYGERNNSQAETSKIPIQISYLFLFKRIENVEKLAAEEEAKGKDGKIYRQHYKNKAKLTDEQNAALFKVVKDCLAEVSKKDAEAKKIIDREHAKHPGGKLNPGEAIPTPPIELTTLQQERDAIVLRYIDVLKQSFNPADFVKFQQFVEQHITPQINTVALTKDLRPVFSTGESVKRISPDPASNPPAVQSEEQK